MSRSRSNSSNPGIACNAPYSDKTREELVELVLQSSRREQYAQEALKTREEQLQRLMEEFNPSDAAEISGLRFENEALTTQLGLMEQEVLRLNEKVNELTRGAQTLQSKVTGYQNAAKVSEEKTAELASQIEVQRLVNAGLTSIVTTPAMAANSPSAPAYNPDNELLPVQRIDWVERLYKVLLDVDHGGVDLKIVKEAMLLHDPSMNWEAMREIMSHVRESASRGSIGHCDLYWWVVVALQGAQVSDASFCEMMRHLVLGTCRSVIKRKLYPHANDGAPAEGDHVSPRDSSSKDIDTMASAVLSCFTRIARGDIYAGTQYWVLQGGVPGVPELSHRICHPDGRELEPWEPVLLSLFAGWVAPGAHELQAPDVSDSDQSSPVVGSKYVSPKEFESRLELVLAHAMGNIVRGPTLDENGQLMSNIGRMGPLDTPEDFVKLLKVAKDTQKPWVDKHSDDIIQVEMIDTKVALVRAVLQLNDITPDLALDVLLDTQVRTKWDPVLEHVNALPNEGAIEEEDFSFDLRIETYYVYIRVKKQMGVAARDCCQRWKVCRNDSMTGAHLVLIEDCKHRDAPEHSKFVRMTTHIAGYILRPSEDGSGCVMTVINQTDVNGNVPTSVVNAFAVKAPIIWQNKIIRACKKRSAGKL